jgi:hypothetical protein
MAIYKFDDLLKKHNVTANQVTTYGSEESINNDLARMESAKNIQPQNKLKEFGGDILGVGKDIVSSSQKRADNMAESRQAYKEGEQGLLRTGLQQVGQLAGAGADAITAVGKGAFNLALSDESEKAVTDVIGKFGAKVMANPQVQNIVNKYNSLSPEDKRDVDAIGGVVDLVSNFVGGQVVSKGADVAGAGIKTGSKSFTEGAKKVATGVADTASSMAKSKVVSGVTQFGSDIAERVPRAINRGKESLAQNAMKAEKIKSASPAFKQAYKTNLDDRIINTVAEADEPTKQAYKQVIDIAEEAPNTVGLKKQPSIIGGDLASKQYDIISKQKKTVGEKIGEFTKQLSKTTKINMQDSFGQIDDTLAGQGIIPQYTKKGVKLDFTGSKYTPAQRTKIQQLYDLATEGGDNLSPSQIKGKDQLFSQLKREANFEGIGDLIIETPEGNKSMFNIFRDIYSNKLDGISPEIKVLNNQYRKLSQVTDDIEDSIFKTPNFNVTKSVDPAEFAKVNLRRIFGEAQSSPTYQAIADIMDSTSRQLGYKGATPKQVAEFAEYIRKLYPETVPKTGFQGGIRAGVSDIIETVSKAGAPNIADQRKALKGLFEDYLQSSKNKTTPKTKPKTPISAVKSQTANKTSKSVISKTIPSNTNKVKSITVGSQSALEKNIKSIVEKNGSGIKNITESDTSYRIEFNDGVDPLIVNKEFLKKNNLNVSFLDKIKTNDTLD